MISSVDLLVSVIRFERVDILKILLDTNNIDIDQKSHNGGESALQDASRMGNLEAVKILLDNNASLNQTDNDGRTPLHEALKRGHIEVAKLLIKTSGDVNQADNYGYTPLLIATDLGHTQ